MEQSFPAGVMATLSAMHSGQAVALQPRAALGAHIPPRGQQDVLSREPCSPVGMELPCSSWMLLKCCRVLELLQFRVGAVGPPHCHGTAGEELLTAAELSAATSTGLPALLWYDGTRGQRCWWGHPSLPK